MIFNLYVIYLRICPDRLIFHWANNEQVKLVEISFLKEFPIPVVKNKRTFFSFLHHGSPNESNISKVLCCLDYTRIFESSSETNGRQWVWIGRCAPAYMLVFRLSFWEPVARCNLRDHATREISSSSRSSNSGSNGNGGATCVHSVQNNANYRLELHEWSGACRWANG